MDRELWKLFVWVHKNRISVYKEIIKVHKTIKNTFFTCYACETHTQILIKHIKVTQIKLPSPHYKEHSILFTPLCCAMLPWQLLGSIQETAGSERFDTEMDRDWHPERGVFMKDIWTRTRVLFHLSLNSVAPVQKDEWWMTFIQTAVDVNRVLELHVKILYCSDTVEHGGFILKVDLSIFQPLWRFGNSDLSYL